MNKQTLADLGFRPPFQSSGLWVTDVRGRNVCETTRELAPEIAASLNQLYAVATAGQCSKS